MRLRAIDEFPDPENVELPEMVPKTGLYVLMRRGLVANVEWEQFGEEECVRELEKVFEREGADALIRGRAGDFLMDKASEPGGLGDDETLFVAQLARDLKDMPWPHPSWNERFRETGQFIEYVSRLRKYNDLSHERGLKLAALRKKRKAFVEAEMEVYDRRRLVREEGRRWGFNTLFHYTALNPLLLPKLPSLPWRHDAEEAKAVLKVLLAGRTRRAAVPAVARLAKLHLLCQGACTR